MVRLSLRGEGAADCDGGVASTLAAGRRERQAGRLRSPLLRGARSNSGIRDFSELCP